ncbi:MAG: DUF1552 domain-containing protein [Myxococcota bacterium]|nr:DUF1552 domain-containing protein [Myxococcota bacterium]
MRRRSFVSALGIGAGLAALPSLRGARADDTPLPRFAVFYTPNDPLEPQHLVPPGSGDRVLSVMPEALEPLSRHAHRLLMIGGLRMPHPAQNHSAIGRVLTARATGGADGHTGDVWGKGPSLDHVLGAHIGTAPLVLGVRTGGRDALSRLSYRASDQPVDPQDDPSAAFAATFGPTIGTNAEREALQARLRRRGSMLDASREQLELARRTVGSADRRRLDAHLESLRALEARVTRDVAGAFSCTTTALELDGGFDHRASLWATRTAELQMDVAVQALSCGVTRVATLQLGTSGDLFGSHVVAPELGIDLGIGVDEHNDVVHDVDLATPARRRRRFDLERIYFDLFARFLDRLAAVPERDGSLLDHTVVLWIKSLATSAHRAEPMHMMLAGGSALGLRTGRYLDRAGQPINALYARIGHLFGAPMDTFGDPTWGGADEYWADRSWRTLGPMEID